MRRYIVTLIGKYSGKYIILRAKDMDIAYCIASRSFYQQVGSVLPDTEYNRHMVIDTYSNKFYGVINERTREFDRVATEVFTV